MTVSLIICLKNQSDSLAQKITYFMHEASKNNSFQHNFNRCSMAVSPIIYLKHQFESLAWVVDIKTVQDF
jgi:hypothetical protein